jgi:ribosomal protein L40E
MAATAQIEDIFDGKGVEAVRAAQSEFQRSHVWCRICGAANDHDGRHCRKCGAEFKEQS